MQPLNRERLLETFCRYDVDKSGSISKKELCELFAELGVSKTDYEIEDIIRSYSSPIDDGCLNFEQFLQLFSVSRLLDVFKELDEDGSGSISSNEISTAMLKLGYRLSKSQCQEMLKKVDIDQSGEISFEEFRVFFENIPLASLEHIAAHWASAVFVTDCGTDMSPTIPPSGLHWWQSVVAGGSGGILSRTATAPLEKIKIAAQTGTSLGRGGMLSEFRAVYNMQGMRGLFGGNLLNCLRVFPTAGITCTMYLNLLALTPADREMDALEPVYRFTCAGVAALVANTLTYPLDLLRARITVAKNSNNNSSNVFLTLRGIISAEGGVKGLYRGLAPTLMAVVPFIAIQNTSIDLLRDWAIERGYEASPLVLVAVGACSGIVAQSVVYPLDVLRRRMQMAASSSIISSSSSTAANVSVVSDSTWMSIRQVVKEEGVKSLFAGIVPTFLKTIPAVAIVATVTGSFNQFFREKNKE